jgi:KaiC/GvpD/RAD55 family RecA-like ATPase
MSQQRPAPYAFDDGLALNGAEPGSILFVAGPALTATEDLALSMVLSGATSGEGMLFVATNTASADLLDRCEELSPGFDEAPVGVVDCGEYDRDEPRFDARVESLSTPSDLTGMGIKFSTLYSSLHGESGGRVRTALVNVSTLFMYTDLRTLFRFLHTLSGRIEATGGIGVFVVDPSTHDEQSVSTLTQLCDGRIDVRDPETGDADGELRVRGLSDQPREWTPFRLGG